MRILRAIKKIWTRNPNQPDQLMVKWEFENYQNLTTYDVGFLGVLQMHYGENFRIIIHHDKQLIGIDHTYQAEAQLDYCYLCIGSDHTDGEVFWVCKKCERRLQEVITNSKGSND